MTFTRRSRIISVRVSQEEYEQVERISRERGAHSVSDFVRWVLTTSGISSASSEPCNCGILAQVANLQRQVDWLSAIVTQSRGDGGSDSGGLQRELGEKCSLVPASVLCEPAEQA